MLPNRTINNIRRDNGISKDTPIISVAVYSTQTLLSRHGDRFGLKTDRIIPGCSIRQINHPEYGWPTAHSDMYKTIHELVQALHTIHGEFYIIHVNMVNGDWEDNEICGYPISSDEERRPRILPAYIEYITARGLYSQPSITV